MKQIEWYVGEKKSFFQSKYDYYRKFNSQAIIIATVTSLFYFVSDCQLSGRISWETLFPRTIILLPLLIYLVLQKKVKDYRILVIATYLMIHGIMWCTIWATSYLPNREHANEGFIIMHLLFFAIGFSASFRASAIAHSLLMADILVSDLFNHYEHMDLILSLGIPCIIGVCAVQYTMGKVYLDQFVTRKKLEEALRYDPLTRVFNRNKLVDILEKDGTRLAFENQEETAFMIIDIDHFKKVNDTYGHEEGDRVLVHMAEVIKKCIRAVDLAIRWGGEEFIIIMPGCSLEHAKQKADRIRREVQFSNNQICTITVSIGISMYDGNDYFKAVSDADKAMYLAKEKGRNCVVCFEEGSEIEVR